jgi:adenosylcobinamide amidohydrolase
MTKTKREIWEEVTKLLNLSQFRQTMGCPMTYDSKFERAKTVSKSKKVHALCDAGLKAPITNNQECGQCGIQMKSYFLKDGLCNGCRNPHLIVTAQVKGA